MWPGVRGVVDSEIVQHRPVNRERLTTWPSLLQNRYLAILTLCHVRSEFLQADKYIRPDNPGNNIVIDRLTSVLVRRGE